MAKKHKVPDNRKGIPHTPGGQPLAPIETDSKSIKVTFVPNNITVENDDILFCDVIVDGIAIAWKTTVCKGRGIVDPIKQKYDVKPQSSIEIRIHKKIGKASL